MGVAGIGACISMVIVDGWVPSFWRGECLHRLMALPPLMRNGSSGVSCRSQKLAPPTLCTESALAHGAPTLIRRYPMGVPRLLRRLVDP